MIVMSDPWWSIANWSMGSFRCTNTSFEFCLFMPQVHMCLIGVRYVRCVRSMLECLLSHVRVSAMTIITYNDNGRGLVDKQLQCWNEIASSGVGAITVSDWSLSTIYTTILKNRLCNICLNMSCSWTESSCS